MDSLVSANIVGDLVTFHINMDSYPIKYIEIYQNGERIGAFEPVRTLQLKNRHREPVTVVCVDNTQVRRPFHFQFSSRSNQQEPFEDFKPGDILVASDNYGDTFPSGYIGHSAIVVDEQHMIEAVTSDPQVRKSLITDFLSTHTEVLHARSKDPNIGLAAAQYAEGYLNQYNENLQNEDPVPPFSFTPFVSLDDPWSAIYCSKLVWLSYYYGAGVEFSNPFFLFAPVDLKENIKDDDNFEVVYEHPNFDFKISLNWEHYLK
ncbi:C40 family peptidase [Alkalibacillus aidingensis]|uniref:hypothetical protein n=1 Tax=Alkalibacillus aidingensis TaxID=2747607 RepID=UPI0016601F49|nr:hypothetical protein [Alkalibacillus aidingensis]